MSKWKIITISTISVIILTTILLFSFVFCLYDFEVTKAEDVEYSSNEVFAASGLNIGTPIFTIDKETAKNKIEKSFPELKVKAIKTTSLRQIEIVVSKRDPKFYISSAGEYYILDEDCKIVAKSETQPYDLIELQLGNQEVTLTVGEFLDENYNKTLSNLYDALYTYVMLPNEDGEYNYLSEEEMCSFIKLINFDISKNNRLKLTLSNNLLIEIHLAHLELPHKINMAFSTYNALYKREEESNSLETMAERYAIVVTYNTENQIIAGINNKQVS